MELLCNLGIAGHGVKQLLGCIPGVAGHKAHQKVAGQLGNLRQQVGKVHADAQILAIGIDILPQKGNLLGTVFNQLAALLQNALRLTAALPPPDIGHDAVGAEIVAAVHNGYPCLEAGVPHLGNALGNGARLILDIKGTLARCQNAV